MVVYWGRKRSPKCTNQIDSSLDMVSDEYVLPYLGSEYVGNQFRNDKLPNCEVLPFNISPDPPHNYAES